MTASDTPAMINFIYGYVNLMWPAIFILIIFGAFTWAMREI